MLRSAAAPPAQWGRLLLGGRYAHQAGAALCLQPSTQQQEQGREGQQQQEPHEHAGCSSCGSSSSSSSSSSSRISISSSSSSSRGFSSSSSCRGGLHGFAAAHGLPPLGAGAAAAAAGAGGGAFGACSSSSSSICGTRALSFWGRAPQTPAPAPAPPQDTADQQQPLFQDQQQLQEQPFAPGGEGAAEACTHLPMPVGDVGEGVAAVHDACNAVEAAALLAAKEESFFAAGWFIDAITTLHVQMGLPW